MYQFQTQSIGTGVPRWDMAGVLVRVLPRNRTHRMCFYIYRKIYFKELAHVIMEAGKSKSCRVGQQAVDPGKSRHCSSSVKVIAGRIPLVCIGEISLVFCSGVKPTRRGPPTLQRGSLLYSESTNLNVNLIQKHPQ